MSASYLLRLRLLVAHVPKINKAHIICLSAGAPAVAAAVRMPRNIRECDVRETRIGDALHWWWWCCSCLFHPSSAIQRNVFLHCFPFLHFSSFSPVNSLSLRRSFFSVFARTCTTTFCVFNETFLSLVSAICFVSLFVRFLFFFSAHFISLNVPAVQRVLGIYSRL